MAKESFSISTQTATHAYVSLSQEKSLGLERTRQQVQKFNSFFFSLPIRIHVHCDSVSHTGINAHFVSHKCLYMLISYTVSLKDNSQICTGSLFSGV